MAILDYLTTTQLKKLIEEKTFLQETKKELNEELNKRLQLKEQKSQLKLQKNDRN